MPGASNAERSRRAVEKPPESGGIKDTFESILIALMLAFIFRAFVVEAFVIPTGSMATTLLGAHMRFKCQDCGYDFTTNFQGQQRPGSDDIVIPGRAVATDRSGRPVDLTFSLICPNCGFRVPRVDRNNPDNDATSPSVHYGDRILVLKYAYIAKPPDRWDVVVFKSPFDSGGNRNGAPEYQQNYIKRLVGLPGEELMVLDGDVYVRPPSSHPSSSLPSAASTAGEGEASLAGFVVQPKPRYVQDALWRVVADNDYQPRGLSRAPLEDYRSPWTIEGNGSTSFVEQNHRRDFVLDASAGGPATVRFDPSANARRFPLTDWLVFDSTYPQQQAQLANPDQHDFRENPPQNTVSDLQLRVTYRRSGGDGPMELNLTKQGHRFIARFLPEAVQLLHVRPDGSEATLGSAALPHGGDAVDVRFENVDYRVAVSVNGREVLASTPEQYGPDLAALFRAYTDRVDRVHRRDPADKDLTNEQPRIWMTAQGQSCVLSHVSLWRDVYYTNLSMGYPPIRWGLPGAPIRLGKGEFFVLGDNSQLSLDARFWERPIDLSRWEELYVEGGRVPERFLLGKAFFVYWPAGFRPLDGFPGIVPNFGQMRVIH